MSERKVFIYAIRDTGSGHIRYVGATTDLRRRKSLGYGATAIGMMLREIDWEYVVLEETDLDGSQAAEIKWISRLKEEGQPLLNVARPERLSARRVAPQARRPGGSTELRPCRVYMSRPELAEQYALAKAAGLSWSTWARRKLAT